MSIGEVLAHLRTEFPDTTISKLRFLEAEGLVQPRRTASGYRKYSWRDVHRLRFVLTAQRDQYLPLRVIREQLRQWELETPQPGRPMLVAVGAEPEPAPARRSSRSAPTRSPPRPGGCRALTWSRAPASTRACWRSSSSSG